MGAADGLERALLALSARCLRVPLHDIDPAAPLVRYGLDSLAALELAEAVVAETGLTLAEDAFFDAPSVQTLALRLLQTPRADGIDRTVQRMRDDAVLDRDVSPCGLPVSRIGAFILTVANGFLGAHLLHELLLQGARDVVCLVRADDDDVAAVRLDEAMRQYGLPSPGASLRALAADIAASHLGLQSAAYEMLAQCGGAIVHCAAEVNWAAPYDALRRVNVESTRTLLRLACTGVAKPFHFVSSVAAGYSTRGSSPLDEDSKTVGPDGIHLGDGQSKWVAERLVEAARDRGLSATIHRPSLIVGHSRTGIGNDDDLFSRLLRGCVALGHAPDLDLPFDACPVDFAARAIALAALNDRSAPRVLHLRSPHRACWTEAVLWMNVRGHGVQLEPYSAWMARVGREVGPDHPLHALRAFLSSRPAGEGGRHLAELYARPHVRELRAERTDAWLAELGLVCPRIGATLLAQYFSRWTDLGLVHPARGRRASRTDSRIDFDHRITHVLQYYFGEPTLRIASHRLAPFGADHSLAGELVSWRVGSEHAMHAGEVDVVRSDGRTAWLQLVLKPRLPDPVVLDVAAELARLCDASLGAAFGRYRSQSEFAGGRARELAVYRAATGTLRDHMPVRFGEFVAGDARTLVLERVTDVELANAVDEVSPWTAARIRAALCGMAGIHAQWTERGSAAVLTQMRPLLQATDAGVAWWSALGMHALRWLRPWFGPKGSDLHRRCVEDIAAVSGWGLPQQDVAELLCFVLDPDRAADEAPTLIEFARLAYQRALRQDVPAAQWHAGMRASLTGFGVARLPLYFLAHRFRPLAFLPRVARCWMSLASRLGTGP